MALGACAAAPPVDSTPPIVVELAPPPTAAADDEMTVVVYDPAGVDGGWAYRTKSNCGSVVAVGEVLFEWRPLSGDYFERGCVYWSDSGVTIYWRGEQRFVESAGELHGSTRNSLGDKVDGRWVLEGHPPERLTGRWRQTNGCHGEGTAGRGDPSAAQANAPPCSAADAGPHLLPR